MSTDHSIRTTLALDAEVLAAARRLAAAREVSLGRVISELARQGLQVAVKPATRRGFPVFAVARTAMPLSLDQVKQDEDDE